MLVLSRNKDDSIIIVPDPDKPDEQVEVVIVDVRGDKVRLGINAPRKWLVHRKEIWTAILKEKEQLKNPEDVKKKFKSKYLGITYFHILRFDFIRNLWKKFFCKRNIHLFDECESDSDHYLYCDACGLYVFIKEFKRDSDFIKDSDCV